MPLTIEQKKQLSAFVPRLQTLEKDFIIALNGELSRTTEQDPQAVLFLRLLEGFRERLEKVKEDFAGFIASVEVDNRKYITTTVGEFDLIFTRIMSLQRFCLELIGSPEIRFADARLFRGTEKEIKDKLRSMPKFLKDYAKSVTRDIASSLETVQRSLAQPATLEVFQKRLIALRCQRRQEFLYGEFRHNVVKMIFSRTNIQLDEDLQAHYGILNRSLPEKIEKEYAEEMLKALRAIEFVGDSPGVLRHVTLDGMVVVLTTQRLLDECAAHVAVLTSGWHGKTSTWAESSVTRARESLRQAQIWSRSAISGCTSLPEVFHGGKRVIFADMLRDILRVASDELAAAIESKVTSVVAIDTKEKSEEATEVVGDAASLVDGGSEKQPVPQAAIVEEKPEVVVEPSFFAPLFIPDAIPAEDVKASSLVLEPKSASVLVVADQLEPSAAAVPPAAVSEDREKPLVPPPAPIAVVIPQVSKEVPVVESGAPKPEEKPQAPLPLAESVLVETASAAKEAKDVSGDRNAEIRRRVRMSVAENPCLAAMAAMFRSKTQEDSPAAALVVPKKDVVAEGDGAEIAPPVAEGVRPEEVKGSEDDSGAHVVGVSEEETKVVATALARFRERFATCETADQVCGMFDEWDAVFEGHEYTEPDVQDLEKVHALLWARYYILRLQELMPLANAEEYLDEIRSAYFFFYNQDGDQIRVFKDDSIYALFDELYGKIREYFDLETGARQAPSQGEPAATTVPAIPAVGKEPPVVVASVSVAPNSAFLALPKSLAVEPPKTPQDEMRIRIGGILQGALLDKFINGTFSQWVERGSVPERSALESVRLVLMGRTYKLSEPQVEAIIAAAQAILSPKDVPKPS